MKFMDKLRYATNSMSMVLLNLNIFGFSLRGVCSPGFNCHGCPAATFACPVGAISYNLSLRLIPYYAIGTILAVGFIFARLICSFVCPFGFFQDLLHRIPFFKKGKINSKFRYIKYFILVFSVLWAPWYFGQTDSVSFVKITSALDKCDTEGYIYVSQINVLNMSELMLKDLPLTVNFMSPEGTPLEDQAPLHYYIKDLNIPPGERLIVENIPVPNVTADGNNIVLTSPYNYPIRHVPYNLYFCDWCPLGGLTAGMPYSIADAVGVENPTFQIDVKGYWDALTPPTNPDDIIDENNHVDETTDEEISSDNYEETPDEVADETLNNDLEIEETIDEEDPNLDTSLEATPEELEEEVTPDPSQDVCEISFDGDEISHEGDDATCAIDFDTIATDTVLTVTATAVDELPSEGTNWFSLKYCVLYIFIIACFIFSRPFCQTSCPLGAILGIAGRFSPMQMKVDRDTCVNCGLCDKACPMDLDVRKEAGSMECIFCGNCVKRCPKKSITRFFSVKK